MPKAAAAFSWPMLNRLRHAFSRTGKGVFSLVTNYLPLVHFFVLTVRFVHIINGARSLTESTNGTKKQQRTSKTFPGESQDRAASSGKDH